jgi:beta-lactamase regulating signal transducer with metallopeptidase domain/predicted  nucleic acid-binding Zn-ribbon protein
MEFLLPLVLGSIKALVLLSFTAGITLALKRRAARVRAVVWGTAITGCLVIPLVAPLLPTWKFPVPAALERFTTPAVPEVTVGVTLESTRIDEVTAAVHLPELSVDSGADRAFNINWTLVVSGLWTLGAVALFARLGIGSWRVRQALRNAHPIDDPYWLGLFGGALDKARCRRKVQLLWSEAVEVPATVGVLRPTVVLPPRAATWPYDRRRAVLLHEAIHVARLDWPVRTIARVARAIYWFNPLIWWAVRRLDLEQELACDEEVLALGTGASDYACHLLGVARHAVPTPSPAIPALGMARRTHLEERIMTILKRTTHRRVGMAVLIPAAILMAAMVPALAAVYPGQSEPRPAGPELKQIMTEMQEIEAKIEPHIAKIEDIEIRMEPMIEELEDIEISIDMSAMEDIEIKMEPYLERLEAIEIDMEPYHEQMEALEEELQSIELHIEDGTLEEVERQIHAQMEIHMEGLEKIHLEMEPFMKQMQTIHIEMEQLHEQMENIHIDMEPFQEQMAKIHIDLEPFHEQMEQIHIEMEPFHEEMELLGDRMEKALQGEVIAVLQAELGPVIAPGTPLDEAAALIAEDADININDNILKFRASKRRTREVLTDLLSDHRVGTQKAFDEAIDSAVAALSPLVIVAD